MNNRVRSVASLAVLSAVFLVIIAPSAVAGEAYEQPVVLSAGAMPEAELVKSEYHVNQKMLVMVTANAAVPVGITASATPVGA